MRETVESVLQQSFTDFELITVDDGSTDNTREILESFGSRLRLLEHPGGVNKGQSAAINLGIEYSKGRYIAILDSDDFWHREKLARQMAFFGERPDADLVYCNGQAVDATGQHLYDIYEPGHVETNDPAALLLNCYIAIPSNALARRSLYDKAGLLDESMRAAQDHDLGIRLAEAGNFLYIDEELLELSSSCMIRFPVRYADHRWRFGFQILERMRQTATHISRSVVRQRRAVLHFQTCAVLR